MKQKSKSLRRYKMTENLKKVAAFAVSGGCGSADPKPACGTADPKPACGTADPKPACGTADPK